MEVYAPVLPESVARILGVVVAVLFSGFAIARLRALWAARLLAWASLPAAVGAAEWIASVESAGFRMLALVAVGFVAMKGIVAVEAAGAGGLKLSLWRWFCFSLGWFGMRPDIFAARRRWAIGGGRKLLTRALVNALSGCALVALAGLVAQKVGSRLVATLLLLPGLSLILHFGIMTGLAGLWRFRGVDCDPLFKAPLVSQSLTEFWGKRWNLAFSEMTALAIYRPLAGRVGRRWALMAAFLFSGLLHEMAISLPVRANFGRPMAYFALHGALVLIEREIARRGHPLRGRVGRFWTLVWLAAPLALVFHVPFLEGVAWPLIGLTALSSTGASTGGP